MQSALEMAQLPYHDYSLASATTQMAILHQLRGEVRNVERYADTTLQLASAGGFPYRIATGRILRGWTLAAQGKHEEGIHFLRKGLKVCHSMGALYDYPYFLALLAQACGWAGQMEEALDAIDEAQTTIQKCRHFFFNPEC
jgi:predicted ATPase